MKVSFYAHYNDLDQIHAFLEGTHEEEYKVEVYNNVSHYETSKYEFVKSLILVTVTYAEYLKLEPILEFIR